MGEERFGDVTVVVGEDFVATVEMHRPPENYFDLDVIKGIADAYEALDDHPACRAILLCSEGKHFCAGAKLTGRRQSSDTRPPDGAPDLVHREVVRLFSFRKPVVAAVQGAAVGAGLGLACSADLRVGSVETRMAGNFSRFGYHPMFGLSVTLTSIVGRQRAVDLLFTGRRLRGEEAATMGLLDRLAGSERVRKVAHQLAAEVAAGAPLAVQCVRRTLRAGLVEEFRRATEHEAFEQQWLQSTADCREGVTAAAEGRAPTFRGR